MTASTTPRSADSVGTSPCMMAKASRSWAPTPTSRRTEPVARIIDDAADLQATDLAQHDPVLDHRLRATDLDGRHQRHVVGTGCGWRHDRLGQPGQQHALVDVPDPDGEVEGLGPPGQQPGLALGQHVQGRRPLAERPRQRRTQPPVRCLLQHHPRLAVGQCRGAGGKHAGSDLDITAEVIAHQCRQFQGPEPGPTGLVLGVRHGRGRYWRIVSLGRVPPVLPAGRSRSADSRSAPATRRTRHDHDQLERRDATARPAPTAPFGSVFSPLMSVARFDGETWSEPTITPLDSFQMHPGAHALHYGSACFEGLKAHRQVDGSARAFRADAHAARMAQSAGRLCLPVPPPELTQRLIAMAVEANEDTVPDPPGACISGRPCWAWTRRSGRRRTRADRRSSSCSPARSATISHPDRLTIAVETEVPRTTPQFGVVKAGANYAMALTPIMAARQQYAADQVLFAPGGIVQETGASNIVLIDGDHLVTPALTDAYLHGVTRDSLLKVARSMGWQVDERELSLADVVEWIARPTAELALTGTAAVVGAVGTLVVDGSHCSGRNAGVRRRGRPNCAARLIEIQTGQRTHDF